MRKLIKRFLEVTSDKSFIHLIEIIEVIVSKLLSLLMVIVIFATLADLAMFVFRQILSPGGSFSKILFEVFGLFLNVLIALEILENITGYLKKHIVQVELVIATSLIAIARKIIILDLKVTEGIEIIGLGIAVLSLSISYWIIRTSHSQK